MDYLTEFIWYASWPILLYVGLKFVELNLKHYKNMESLEEFQNLQADNK